MSFNLSLISKHRTHLMGIASLMIIVCHFSVYVESMPKSLKFLFNYGNLGVDIFLLLSGVGCYFSLCRCNIYKYFLKKRFVRIIIPYTLISAIFLFLPVLYGDNTLKDAFYVFSTFSYWIEHRGAWYVALLVPLYILAPVLFTTLNTSRHRCMTACLIIIIIQILSHITICTDINVVNNIIHNAQFAFGRCISFVIGMYLAPMIHENKKLGHIGLLCICCFIIYLIPRLFFKNIFFGWSLVPIIIIVLCVILERLSFKNLFCRFIELWGGMSLESYLTNMHLCGSMATIIYFLGFRRYVHSQYFEYLLIIVFGFILSYLISVVCYKLKK